MPAVDQYASLTTGATSPFRNATAVTPSDSTDLAYVSRALYVGNDGHVTVILAGDTEPVTFFNLAPGIPHHFRVSRVLATGTTTTGIVAVR